MLTWQSFPGAVFCFGLVALGCAGAPAGEAGEEDIGESEQRVVASNRLSLNRLSLNRLSLNGLSLARLATDDLALATTDLILDPAGRELLRYVVRCSMPAGTELYGTADGEGHAFTGLIGLAPQWLARSLKLKEQRWISACLMAHVNGYGLEVPISLRGRHPALAAEEIERATYTEQEISYYGNVFIHENDADELEDWGPKMYTCAGGHVQAACGGSAATFGPLRACGGVASCGVSFFGGCRAIDGIGPSVCKKEIDDGYSKCRSQAPGSVEWPDESYKQVITVYLKPDDFQALYPGCVGLP